LSDKSKEIIITGLRRAAVEPAGLPLHGGRQSLFAASASGKKAAQHCKSEGLLQTLRTDSRGRSIREICAITEKGLAYLLRQVSPKHVLEELVQALHSQQNQVGELLATAHRWQANLDACKTLVEKVLRRESSWAAHDGNGKTECVPGEPMDRTESPKAKTMGNSDTPTLREAIHSQLRQWRESAAASDCPLPELFRCVEQNRFTIGQFHDQLRVLHEQELIYLHPWTGPLPEIPEPAVALLIGHGIAYYASVR
jgi:hypothetical protein